MRILSSTILSGLVCIIFVCSAWAKTEWVYVSNVLSNDDKAIVTRSNGQAYLIEKGVGCLSLWRKEGKDVLVDSPGLFLGVGSRLILPDEGQECRIWNAEPLEAGAASTRPRVQPRAATPQSGASSVATLQSVLNQLGYGAGVPDGVFGRQTAAALRAFQQAHRLPTTGEPDGPTVQALVAQIKAGAVTASPLASTSDTCIEGHWVEQVMDGGSFVRLQDGSLWQIDPVDRIDSGLWLPTEEIAICGDERLINTDSGDQVRANRLR